MAQCFLHISLVLTVNQGSLGITKTRVGEGNGNPLQYSCQENSMDEGAWQAAVQGVEKGRT